MREALKECIMYIFFIILLFLVFIGMSVSTRNMEHNKKIVHNTFSYNGKCYDLAVEVGESNKQIVTEIHCDKRRK